MLSANEALERLRAGNRRFVNHVQIHDPATSDLRRHQLAAGQEPFAIIVGCSDSRVPAEQVFNQGLGDLFVIRIAGNIVSTTQIGSVEFAATSFVTPLVVVLGHSHCGAVRTTIDQLRQPKEDQSAGLRSIVDHIRPAVEPLLEAGPGHDTEALVAQAVRENIRVAVNDLQKGSAIIERLVEAGELMIVGAEYSLDTGIVDFFDQMPEI